MGKRSVLPLGIKPPRPFAGIKQDKGVDYHCFKTHRELGIRRQEHLGVHLLEITILHSFVYTSDHSLFWIKAKNKHF